MKTFKYNEVECYLEIAGYANNGNMAIVLRVAEGPLQDAHYGTATVNLHPVDDDYGFLDYNNMPLIPGIFESLGIAKPTGIKARSGYCSYPLYQFDMNVLREYTI